MKTIVSHMSPDIDSISSVWLVRKYMPGWMKAHIVFVSAGSTFENKNPDENPDIIHVDTGFGMFDHHQNSKKICAASLVYDFLVSKGFLPEKHVKPLERMINEIIGFDHFEEVAFPSPEADRYEFLIHKIIDAGLKPVLKNDFEIMESVFPFLEGILNIFVRKVAAEKEIKKGFVFNSSIGKTIIMSTRNEETTKLALKMGYRLVVKKDPDKGGIRIKSYPGKKYDLNDLYKKILKIDRKGTWFLHASGNMLLNSSSKNPKFVPSPLSIQKLIEIVKEI